MTPAFGVGASRYTGSDSGAFGGLRDDNILDAPEAVFGLLDATAMTCGDEFGCALRATGSVECWGADPATGAGYAAHRTGGAVVGLP